ncbi:MAG: PLP-dependent transferase [Candidatus Malihini olakiniferum]
MRIAHWFAERTEVAVVNYPALPSCKGYEFYVRDFTGCNELFSFVLKQKAEQGVTLQLSG